MNILIKPSVALLACLSLLGCIRPIVSPGDGETLVKISATCAGTELAGGTRTIMPKAPSSIVLYGSSSGEDPLPRLESFESLSGAVIRISPGTWTFRLEALDEDGAAILTPDTKANISIGPALVTLSFSFAPLSSGMGSLEITVAWPAGKDIASATLELEGPSPDTSVQSFSGTVQSFSGTELAATGVRFAQTGLASGSYTATAVFKDAAGMTVATLVELVRILPGMSSEAAIDLSSGDINGPPAAPASISCEQAASSLDSAMVTVAWTDSSDDETGFVIQRKTGEADWVELALPGAGASSYTDYAPRLGSYRYRIRSRNGFGDSAWTEYDGSVSTPALLKLTQFSGPATSTSSFFALYHESIADPVSLPFASTVLGYKLAGYSKTSGSKTAEYLEGGEYTMVSAVETLYTVWKECSKYQVVFDGNGAVYSLQYYVNDGSKLTAPTPPARTGYTFTYWSASSGGSAKWNFDTDTVQGYLELYAQWRPVQSISATIDIAQGDTMTLGGSLSAAKGTVLSVSVVQTFSSYSWCLDGDIIPGAAGQSVSIDTASFEAGTHELLVLVQNAAGQGSSARYLISVTN